MAETIQAISDSHVDDWVRVGKGRELQFFATDDEVQNWLLRGLPPEYRPYRLIGTDLTKEGRASVEEPFQCEISALLQCMRAAPDARSSFWIWSGALSPDLPDHLRRGARVGMLCSYNGLVLLQHGSMIRDYSDPARRICRAASRIAIVDRVRNMRTGETVEQHGYLEIYRALCKTIAKALVYSSIVRFKDGRELEDERLQRMTEGAVQAYQAGFPFRSRPGRRLKELTRGAPKSAR